MSKIAWIKGMAALTDRDRKLLADFIELLRPNMYTQHVFRKHQKNAMEQMIVEYRDSLLLAKVKFKFVDGVVTDLEREQ